MRPGRSNPKAETSEDVSPVVARSARIRPKVGANLKPCAAPRPTTTEGCPGTGASTKSRSGVSVYWQRSDRTGRPEPGRSEPTKLARRSSISGSGSEVRWSGSTTGPPQSCAALIVGLAVAGEAVVGRLVHPDPQRHVRERPRVGRPEVRRLLERDGERDLDAEPREHLVGPGIGADHHPAARVRRARGLDGEVGAVVLDAGDRGRAQQRGAVRRREALHRGGTARRRDDRAAGLEQATCAGGWVEHRPAPPDLRDVELLELDADLAHRRHVVERRDGAVGREEIEAADHGDEPLARLVLEPGPVVVRLAGEPHIRRRVVAVPQDSRGVVGGAAAVAELELLEPDDGVTAGGQVPRRGRAERTQSDDDVVDVSHARAWAATSAGCRPSRPPSGRTSRGCRRARTCRAAPTRRSPSPGG